MITAGHIASIGTQVSRHNEDHEPARQVTCMQYYRFGTHFLLLLHRIYAINSFTGTKKTQISTKVYRGLADP